MEDLKAKNLLEYCQNYINKQKITCGETIHQCDHVILSAYEFIEGVCDIVGYHDPYFYVQDLKKALGQENSQVFYGTERVLPIGLKDGDLCFSTENSETPFYLCEKDDFETRQSS